MSIEAYLFRRGAGKNDRKRNAATVHPAGVHCCDDVRYGPEKDHLLNVYYPEGTAAPLPTIVSIHGGGYVYGSKEVYHHYCASLASRGFTVVNFNYRLAPRHKFPAPLEDTNRVMKWLVACAGKYHMDPGKVFLVGDSAGAQLASQYAAIWSNPAYATHFPFTVPQIQLRAIGLNCGMYDLSARAQKRKGIAADYMPKGMAPNDPRLDVLGSIGPGYPPADLTTAQNDFLRDNAQPMAEFLESKGVEARYKIYGTPEQKHISHVFHVDIRNPEATECNDAQCDFFRAHL